MNTMLDKIQQLHSKFQLTHDVVPFSPEEKNFRILCLREELDEFAEAENAVDEFDALIDLVVFAFGTVERKGWLPQFEEGFNRVMKANMAKEVGQNKHKARGDYALDLVKPEGWEAPNHDDLVGPLSDIGKAKSAIEQTVEGRSGRYGEFAENARITQGMMNIIRTSPNFPTLPDVHAEAFQMICHKIARAVCGDPNHEDNAHDIAGYALCLEKAIKKGGPNVEPKNKG